MENGENSFEPSIWEDYSLETKETRSEEKIEYTNEITKQLLAKLNDTTLTEEKLREIMEKASIIKADNKKGEVLIKVAEHIHASPKLIQETRKYIAKIEDNSIRTGYLENLDRFYADKIKTQFLLKIDDEALTEQELSKFMEEISAIKTPETKYWLLTGVATHELASIELIQKIEKHISIELKTKNTQLDSQEIETITEIIDKTLRKKQEANKIMRDLLVKLDDKTLTEENLKKIKETALDVTTRYEKYKILAAIAKHPQTSKELIQEIKEYISYDIVNSTIREKYLKKIDELYANKVMKQSLIKLDDTTLTKENLEEITNKALTVETDYEKGKILAAIVKHQNASIKLIKKIKDYVSFKIKNKQIREKYFKKVTKSYNDKITEQLLPKLDDKTLTEEDLKKIAKIALTINNDGKKCKILNKVTEHPQASTRLIEEIKLDIKYKTFTDSIKKEDLEGIYKMLSKNKNKIETQQTEQYKKASEEVSKELSTSSSLALLD